MWKDILTVVKLSRFKVYSLQAVNLNGAILFDSIIAKSFLQLIDDWYHFPFVLEIFFFFIR